MQHETPSAPAIFTDTFREDVLRGLALKEKAISSRYFYDAEGDRIFQAIMAMPEYYPTRAEEEIMRDRTDAVLEALVADAQRPELLELGAGDGTKTKHLLRRLLETGRDPLYRPIDISSHALEVLGRELQKDLPTLRYKGEQGEYFEALQRCFGDRSLRRAVLFLGGNIGNLVRDRAIHLLSGVAQALGPDDRFLVGFDLKKDPARILAAYNDDSGHTRRFNLNLLHRINRELGADFDVDAFVHTPVYDPMSGRAMSFLVSIREQQVHIPGAAGPFHFRAWEAIHTEISQKYDMDMIQDLAENAGLRITASFTDQQRLFTDVVFAPLQMTNGR